MYRKAPRMSNYLDHAVLYQCSSKPKALVINVIVDVWEVYNTGHLVPRLDHKR